MGPQYNFFHSGGKKSTYDTYPFIIEKKNGTISQQSMELGKSSPCKYLGSFLGCFNAHMMDKNLQITPASMNYGADQILANMAKAINFSPPPRPSEAAVSHPEHVTHNAHSPGFTKPICKKNGVDDFIWMHGWGGSQQHKSPSSMNRNLFYFLSNVDFNDIKQRKLDRVNAIATALVARRAFQFSAIDGTGLGWSSASLAVCLSSLTALHEEHQMTMIKSFYPFRLMLSADEFHNKIDSFGGIIRINPSATSLQQLRILSAVSDGTVNMLKNNQKELKRNLTEVENVLGLRVVRGHTLEPEKYHQCIDRLAMESVQNNINGEGVSFLAISNKKANLVIESNQVCRRGRMRKDGSFEVGSGADLHDIRKTIAKFANKSNKLIQQESEDWARCRKLIDQVMYIFGVQHVKKVSNFVTSNQMAECLSMLLNKDDIEKNDLRGYLAGQSLGIAGRGQLCYLGDDGSIIIPTDCS